MVDHIEELTTENPVNMPKWIIQQLPFFGGGGGGGDVPPATSPTFQLGSVWTVVHMFILLSRAECFELKINKGKIVFVVL